LHSGVFAHAEHDGSLEFAFARVHHAVLHALHAAASQVPKWAENAHSGVFERGEHDGMLSFAFACMQNAVLRARRAAAGTSKILGM